MSNKKQKKDYIDNQKFSQEAAAYVELYNYNTEHGLENPKLSNYLGHCIILLATKISNMPSFNNYNYKEEMIGNGIEIACRYFHGFNPNKISKRTGLPSAGAFPYFTMIIYNRYLKTIADEKLQMFVKQRYVAESDDIFANMAEQDIDDHGEALKEVLSEMSGLEYLDHDIKIAAKKEALRVIKDLEEVNVKPKKKIIEQPLAEFF
jgi:hypothetical protein